MATKVIMPQLGESIVEGTVVKWLKAPGEAVAEFESLLEVETDKVVSEIPSPAGGVLLTVLVGQGMTVGVGTTLAWIGQPGEALPEAAPEATAGASLGSTPAAGKAAVREAAPASAGTEKRELGFISPVVARIAHEKEVDLSQVPGTGQGGRITKKDLLAFIEARSNGSKGVEIWETPADGDLFRPTELVFGKVDPQEPAPAAAPRDGGGALIPHTSMRRQIAEHMVQSKRLAPHVTAVMEADMSRAVAHRDAHRAAFERDGVHLTYTAYFTAAAIAGLKVMPRANSSWTDEGLLVHAAVHVGVAVSLGDEGLIVPVIRDADRLSLLGLARSLNDLAARARSRKLQPEEVRGGTFTITNHGVSGSLLATPIINQPQCGILGVGMIQKRPVVLNDAIAIRPMVYLSLTFDHRILDGASADRFLAAVRAALEGWA
jgi:2-oxoglutarate dehydrogenase E2 component (dihydrolipoamide succinyltransferase)